MKDIKELIRMKVTAIAITLSLLLALSACQTDETTVPSDASGTSQPELQVPDENLLQGCMRIKLKEEPSDTFDFGDGNLRITRMERTFPYAGKYEERTRREGLHLWYNVWFEGNTTATRAAADASLWENIEMAVPIRKVVSTAMPEAETRGTAYGTRAGEWLFNDPGLPKQWYYDNPGTESWQEAGADIRLFEAWKEYNGHPDIIVAIVDGGIEPDHPDLQENLWTNNGEIPDNGIDDDGNGYVDDVFGYNFVDNSPVISGHRHGTHVAGVIAATNHNGIGISSIAGGNGSSASGVRLMNCQILKHNAYMGDELANDIGAAIKYGADNGAVISQNSWGYAADGSSAYSTSYIDPAHKAAIDYFIKYAGCDNNGNQLDDSPMKGGIVFFASGNSNSSNPRIAAPADYEPVVAVAAIEGNYRKASYSNYGTYMDIAAPGGSLAAGASQIWSTTIASYGYYEYRAGTSMACPLVSGVAALVIQKHGVGKKGFTPQKLKEILYESAYDLDSYNPDYAGMLGHGCVDAAAALKLDPSNLQPFTLKSNQITDNVLTFKVSGRMAGEGELTLYNSIGSKVLTLSVHARPSDWQTIDISALSAGYYLLHYRCNGQETEEKFIKY